MVTDTYMRRWPHPASVPPVDYSFLKELIRKAEEYDRIMKQRDCPDPVKTEWWRDVQRMNDAVLYKYVPSTTGE